MRICMLSVHTCPLAALGGKKTGGMNVYSAPDVANQLEHLFIDLQADKPINVQEMSGLSAVG